VSDESVARMGTLLEQLGARFELVLEAVSGFGGKIDALREEMVGQFTEVGRQIRFLSDRIAEKRDGVRANRADLGAEMIRLGDLIGTTRVEFREQLAATRSELSQAAEDSGAKVRASVVEELAQARTDIHEQVTRQVSLISESMQKEIAAAHETLGRELPAAAAGVRSEISSSSGALVTHLDAELKQTNKALANLARKFERFDDRITVQTKEQDQRLRKLERRASR
jgi:hypothetical protein